MAGSRHSLFPQTARQCMEKVTARAFKKKGFIHARILSEWDSIVGPAIAAISLPLEVKFPPGKNVDGCVIIQVSSADALLLQHQEGLLLEKFALYFGYRAIARIALRQQPLPAAPHRPVAPRRPAQPVDIDLTDFPEGELKDALASFSRTMGGD